MAANRSHIEIQKKSTNDDGSIPVDDAGQPDRTWSEVYTVHAQRKDSEAASGEDVEDDAVRANQTVLFILYKPETAIDTSMRVKELSNNDQIYEIRRVREITRTPPKKIEIEAVTDPLD